MLNCEITLDHPSQAPYAHAHHKGPLPASRSTPAPQETVIWRTTTSSTDNPVFRRSPAQEGSAAGARGQWLLAALLVAVLVTAACRSPAQVFAERAGGHGMRAEIVSGAPFDHVLFWQPRRASRSLHVYIDGDGTPWVVDRPAHDPTPRNPLMLRLMNLDPNPSLYLGRPCYHGLATRPPCAAAIWTRERYSERVVVSMAAALRQVIDKRGVTRVAWLGYSGGGVLAVLLAPRFAETAALVTVGGNLDIDAWTDLHGYSRLVGSLNPAANSWARSQVYERHYVGGIDRIVPRAIVDRAGVPPETVSVIPAFDHVCCWETIWPAVVSQVARALGQER